MKLYVRRLTLRIGSLQGLCTMRAEVARTGIPTVMMFTQSLAGLSHNKAEDTKIDDLKMAVEAFDRLARKTLAWLSAK